MRHVNLEEEEKNEDTQLAGLYYGCRLRWYTEQSDSEPEYSWRCNDNQSV